MKLSSKSTIYFILTTLVVFLISGISVYFMLQVIIHHEIDGDLIDKQLMIKQELRDMNGFENFIYPKDFSVTIGSLIQDKIVEEVFSDTSVSEYDYEDQEEELVPFRQLKFAVTINNQTRIVTVRMSLIKSDDLIEAIIFSLIVVFVIMIIALIAVNFISIQRLWMPFHTILMRISEFDFRSRTHFPPVSSNIEEFNELNNELVKMTTKLSNDYFALKEFSENASHEMQTPLAIIQSKLEILFQHPNFEEENLKTLKAAYAATNRLSRLHHELNLLTRIENKEFTEYSPVHLKILVENLLENFNDIIEMKNIVLETDITANPSVKGNKYLLEILLSNLLGNAIKHNIPDGKISLSLTTDAFTISNTGPTLDCPPETLFERFRKGKPSADSTGLGLALAKQICVLHEFNIDYTIQKNQHTIQITF